MNPSKKSADRAAQLADAADVPIDPRWELEPRWSEQDRRELERARRQVEQGPGLASVRADSDVEERETG